MNIDLINFYGAKNVEFEEFKFVEEVGVEVPIFTLTVLPTDEWNKRARIQNTKMFVETFNRLPMSYNEVLSWVNSLQKENQPTANELEFVLR